MLSSVWLTETLLLDKQKGSLLPTPKQKLLIYLHSAKAAVVPPRS